MTWASHISSTYFNHLQQQAEPINRIGPRYNASAPSVTACIKNSLIILQIISLTIIHGLSRDQPVRPHRTWNSLLNCQNITSTASKPTNLYRHLETEENGCALEA